jgi:hypothetical protein
MSIRRSYLRAMTRMAETAASSAALMLSKLLGGLLLLSTP